MLEEYTVDRIDLALNSLRQIAQHPANVPGLYRRYMIAMRDRYEAALAVARMGNSESHDAGFDTPARIVYTDEAKGD